MNRLPGSTRSTRTQCITVPARSLCRNLSAPTPTAISSSALNSLNSPMRMRMKEEEFFAARATISWYLLDYDQHAPSLIDLGAVHPVWMGHTAGGHQFGGTSATFLV